MQNNPMRRSRGGQAMLEYVIVFCVIASTIVALSFLLVALKENGARVLDLVASEYP